MGLSGLLRCVIAALLAGAFLSGCATSNVKRDASPEPEKPAAAPAEKPRAAEPEAVKPAPKPVPAPKSVQPKPAEVKPKPKPVAKPGTAGNTVTRPKAVPAPKPVAKAAAREEPRPASVKPGPKSTGPPGKAVRRARPRNVRPPGPPSATALVPPAPVSPHCGNGWAWALVGAVFAVVSVAAFRRLRRKDAAVTGTVPPPGPEAPES
jgi:outer membrane biosynthesis protein TonB